MGLPHICDPSFGLRGKQGRVGTHGTADSFWNAWKIRSTECIPCVPKPLGLERLFAVLLFAFPRFDLAGELGFEPRFSESESDVLPLNYSPTDRAQVGGIRMALTWGNLTKLTSPKPRRGGIRRGAGAAPGPSTPRSCKKPPRRRKSAGQRCLLY